MEADDNSQVHDFLGENTASPLLILINKFCSFKSFSFAFNIISSLNIYKWAGMNLSLKFFTESLKEVCSSISIFDSWSLESIS